MTFDVKGELGPRAGIQWQNKGAYDWNVPARYPVFMPLEDGWRRGTIVVRVPHGVDLMALHLGTKHRTANEKTWFGQIAIYRLDQ